MSDDNEQLRAKSARVTAERDEARAELLRRTAECDEVRARGRELRREVEALAVERDALREALATQAAAVRQLDVARTARHDADARDAETLRRRQQAPGDVLAEIAAVREEARMWNARATELEGERDALRSELDAMRLRWEYASGALEDLSRGCSEALSPRMSFDATRPAREIVERITAVVAERDALREDVKSGARTTLVILRRVRDALGAIGVPGIADCDDPLSALDATVAEALEASRALREGAAREVDAHNALVGRLAKALDECDALRAIVEGRPTAPTQEEIAAHPGQWLVYYAARFEDRQPARTRLLDRTRATAAAAARWPTAPSRWCPVRDGRPCAWPVVAKHAEASR